MDQPGSGGGRISEEKAALVLDRAARLDAGHGKLVEVAELREAALEAGISLEAFERALIEVEQLIARRDSGGSAAVAATPTPEAKPHTVAYRVSMLASGFFLGGLALLLSGPFGLQDAGIAFSLLIALAVVIGSVLRNRRKRDVLGFEIELWLLWVGLTLLLMIGSDAETVLATMSLFGALAGVTGGALVALSGSARTPDQLGDGT